jgi:hypothetical protein
LLDNAFHSSLIHFHNIPKAADWELVQFRKTLPYHSQSIERRGFGHPLNFDLGHTKSHLKRALRALQSRLRRAGHFRCRDRFPCPQCRGDRPRRPGARPVLPGRERRSGAFGTGRPADPTGASAVAWSAPRPPCADSAGGLCHATLAQVPRNGSRPWVLASVPLRSRGSPRIHACAEMSGFPHFLCF